MRTNRILGVLDLSGNYIKNQIVDAIQKYVNTNKVRNAAKLTGLYFLKKIFSKEVLSNKTKVDLSFKCNNT